ncbi:MAG: conserved hypothetical protein [Methanobrevibacter sp. CfCl-M3]
MEKYCKRVHEYFNNLEKHDFPFNESKIPKNGLYVLFEKNEYSHGMNRIVMVGTHTGNKSTLVDRLNEHLKENKDRSIFRKHIGRALLNKENDPFLEWWNKDLTSRENKEIYSDKIDFSKQKEVESKVTEYIRNNFLFVATPIDDLKERKYFEKKLIATINSCGECKPSSNWLGLSHPNKKIGKSGLWNVQNLQGTSLSENDLNTLLSTKLDVNKWDDEVNKSNKEKSTVMHESIELSSENKDQKSLCARLKDKLINRYKP